MRSAILAGCLVGILMIGTYWTAEDITTRAWSSEVESALKHRQLSDLRGCLFAMNSDLMFLVRTFNIKNSRTLAWRTAKCDDILEDLGRAEQDEETDRVLGEAKLFFSGYLNLINDVLELQLELETLYGNFSEDKMGEARQLEHQQNKYLSEAQKFLERLNKLIVRTW